MPTTTWSEGSSSGSLETKSRAPGTASWPRSTVRRVVSAVPWPLATVHDGWGSACAPVYIRASQSAAATTWAGSPCTLEAESPPMPKPTRCSFPRRSRIWLPARASSSPTEASIRSRACQTHGICSLPLPDNAPVPRPSASPEQSAHRLLSLEASAKSVGSARLRARARVRVSLLPWARPALAATGASASHYLARAGSLDRGVTRAQRFSPGPASAVLWCGLVVVTARIVWATNCGSSSIGTCPTPSSTMKFAAGIRSRARER
jgi:hypothetical protein